MYESIKFINGGKFTSRGSWIHPQRVIDSHELILVLQGTVPIFAGQNSYDLVPGDLLHIPPGLLHGGTNLQEETVSFYWLHFERCAETDVLPQEHTASRDFGRAEILCKQLLHCANSPEYPSDCADYYMRLLLFELRVQHPNASPLCEAVEEWIRCHSEQAIQVKDVSAHFALNPDYLNRVFRKYHPEGLKRYLDSQRCQRIKKDLVSTDMTLQELAVKYGFAEYKYFLKYFRFHEGMTPTQYRDAYYSIHTNWK